jgi:hypothetical membrane protein
MKSVTKDFNLDKYLILAGVVGPLTFFFTIFFLFDIMYPGYDPVNQYISELGAVDSPVRVLASVFGFSLLGVFTMMFSYGLYRTKELSKLARFSALFFFLTGVLMFMVGVFSCDAQCSNYSIRGLIHSYSSSTLQTPIMAVGFILFALGVLTHKRFRVLVPVIAVLGGTSLVLAYIRATNYDLTHVGIYQRLAIGLPYFLLAIIAFVIYRVRFSDV